MGARHDTAGGSPHAGESGPGLPDGLHLPRPELVKFIAGAQGVRVVIVRAAAGFGKTTLLKEYQAFALQAGHRVCWLSLTSQDNDLDRFVTHFAAVVHPPLSASAMAQAGGQDGLAGVLSGLGAQSQQFSIVLDDFEAIDDSAVLSLVQQLADNIPPNGRLLIASRNTPRLNFGRLRARGQLLDIGHGLLRFSVQELQAYLRGKRRLLISDASIDALHRRTEGWPAAIYLASLSLQESGDTASAVAAFSGNHIELAQFLAEDVFDRLEPRLRDFMQKTSVLQQMSGPLCDAALQMHGSREILEDLQRQNLFISRSDNDGEWYRHHSLFASFLRNRLERELPGAGSRISDAAAHWYGEHGHHIWAVEQHLANGAIAEAVAIMESRAAGMQERGRTRLLVRWFDRISADTAAGRPQLGMVMAWALMFNRRYADASPLMDEIVRRCSDPQVRHAVQVEAAALRCVKRAMSERAQEACDEGRRLDEALPAQAGYQRAALANALSFALIALNRYDDARLQLQRAVQGSASQADIMRPIRVVVEAIIDLAQGRLGDGLARLEASRHDVQAEGQRGAASEGKPSADVLRALAYYECGRLRDCADSLGQALAYAKSYVSDDSLIISHVLSARLAWLADDRKTCLRLLAEMEQLGRRSASPRVICSAWLERSRLSLMDGQLAAAEEALRAAETESAWAASGLSFYANDVETPFVARARLRIVRGQVAGLREELQDAIEEARRDSRHRRALSLRVLLAAVLHCQGQGGEACLVLDAVLAEAAHEGYLRCLVDEAVVLKDLAPWLEAGRQPEPRWPAGVARFVAQMRDEAQPAEGPPAAAVAAAPAASAAPAVGAGLPPQESLSTRELQIVRLLATGLRNKAIAEKLSLSEFTVKSHLRNIHAKLGASARTEAVAIARARGLLEG